MRTNIEIDDTLMAEAMQALGTATKRDTVEESLRRAVRTARRLKAYDDMQGIGWDGDLDATRTDKPLPEWE